MNPRRTVFAQLVEGIHREQFQRCVERYGGDRRVRRFSCRNQFLAMAFAQLTYRESLRDIEACLRSRSELLYSLGFRREVARSTLAEANETRDWRIYADLAQKLIVKARRLYANEELGLELEETVYAFDSTTIDLCLSLFPWAHFRKRKGAIKLHTLLDLRGPIPTVIEITEGKCHDVNLLDSLGIEPGAFYVMDRGYLDFARLSVVHQACAYFVIRAKKNLRFTRYTFASLYKLRWQVELFFKWIKQHLRIKTFYGTSDNAVRTQIWIAVCVYLLIAILKKELRLPQSLHSILQVLSVTAFEKVPIYQLLMKHGLQESHSPSFNQLTLWDL